MELEIAPVARQSEPGTGTKGSLPQLRVLVAEDTLSSRAVVRVVLKRLGVQADEVSNGADAVDAIMAAAKAGTPYNVVLMDVQMPVMDGLEVTRIVRGALPEAQQPRILAVTANALRGFEEKCLEAGMDLYITKPFEANRLLEALAQVAS